MSPISEKGQSLVEVIVAATVGILVVSALTFATIFSLRNAGFAKNSAQATKLAQEGIERVRTGRDRNSRITISGVSVNSWSGTQPIWSYQITAPQGCDNPSTGGKCYFNVDSASGALTNNPFGFALTSFPASPPAEKIPSANQTFQRVVTLSDEATTYTNQKTVTVIVRWNDFAGPHESKLITILRKL